MHGQAGRKPNERERNVLKEVMKEKVPKLLGKHGQPALSCVVDVSQTKRFARSGLAECPTYATSSKMCYVPPGKGVPEAFILDINTGLATCLYSCHGLAWNTVV